MTTRARTPAQIIAEAVSDDDRRGHRQKPRWRHLSLSERDRLADAHEAGDYDVYSYGEYTLYRQAAPYGDLGCITHGPERIIEVDCTPELLTLFAADILPCGCPRRIVIDEGHQEGCYLDMEHHEPDDREAIEGPAHTYDPESGTISEPIARTR
jgi:hypothetical protein